MRGRQKKPRPKSSPTSLLRVTSWCWPVLKAMWCDIVPFQTPCREYNKVDGGVEFRVTETGGSAMPTWLRMNPQRRLIDCSGSAPCNPPPPRLAMPCAPACLDKSLPPCLLHHKNTKDIKNAWVPWVENYEERVDEYMDEWKCGMLNGWLDECVYDRWMTEYMDEYMEGWVDGWMNGY